MAFELGIPLSKSIEEQLTATLREKLPSLEEFSNEEIVRRVEAADVLGALGTNRRIPVLHNLSGLVDQERFFALWFPERSRIRFRCADR